MQTVLMGYCVSSKCASPIDIYYVLYTCSHHKCLLHRETQLMSSMCVVVMGQLLSSSSCMKWWWTTFVESRKRIIWNAPITENIPVSSLSESGSSPSASQRQWQPQLAGWITYTLHVSWFGIFSAGTQSTCLTVRFMVLFLSIHLFSGILPSLTCQGLVLTALGRGKWEIYTFSEKPAARDNMLL